MSQEKQSDIFKQNLFFWKMFFIWPLENKGKYKYLSWLYITINLFIYNILLTLNLINTPRNIELIIREAIFYFNEIGVTAKVLMIVTMKDKIIEAFNLLDGDELKADDEVSEQIIDNCKKTYNIVYKGLSIMCHISFVSYVLMPLFFHLFFDAKLELPISVYYFLSKEFKEKYFALLYLYQAFGIYVHMIYNISIDSFIAGLLFKILIHCKIIEHKLFNLRLSGKEKKLSYDKQEIIQFNRLKYILKRYDAWLRYIAISQNILDVTLFVQHSMSCLIICVSMCGFLLPASAESHIFLIIYLFVMTQQIFVPSYLGTQIKYASEDLVFAAYNTEWITRSESFKRSIKVFVERANNPIQVSALKMFPLSLTTFTSIMKTAYSSFTLVRSFQDN